MKFIASYFDKEIKESTVIVEHMGIEFIGKSRVHPEDFNRASELVGGSYAETRAIIKALKYEHKIAKEKCEECRKFIKACTCYKDFDKDSPTARTIYKQLNVRIKRVNEIATEINNLELFLKKSMITRDVILKEINKSKEIKE